MIGGTDFMIPIRDKTEALDLAIRLVLRLWPNALIEDATAEEVLPPFELINFFGRHDLLAFRDKESADKWDELGADPLLDETLIHVIAISSQQCRERSREHRSSSRRAASVSHRT